VLRMQPTVQPSAWTLANGGVLSCTQRPSDLAHLLALRQLANDRTVRAHHVLPVHRGAAANLGSI
jgi:hypothetical protein